MNEIILHVLVYIFCSSNNTVWDHQCDVCSSRVLVLAFLFFLFHFSNLFQWINSPVNLHMWHLRYSSIVVQWLSWRTILYTFPSISFSRDVPLWAVVNVWGLYSHSFVCLVLKWTHHHTPLETFQGSCYPYLNNNLYILVLTFGSLMSRTWCHTVISILVRHLLTMSNQLHINRLLCSLICKMSDDVFQSIYEHFLL